MCTNLSRKEIDAIAERVLEGNEWRKLNIENLCWVLHEEFEQRRQSVESILTHPVIDEEPIENAITHIGATPNVPENDHLKQRVAKYNRIIQTVGNTNYIRKLGEGVDGMVWLCNSNSDDYVVKQSKIQHNFPNGDMEEMFETHLKEACDTEFTIEYAVLELLSELVLQNICPHFPLQYLATINTDAYNVMELIPNGQTFYDWFKDWEYDLSERQFLSLMFQIAVALHAMQKYFDLTHRDLHPRNIMIYDLGKDWESGYFIYNIDSRSYYVPVFGIMVCLVDFGRASIPGKLGNQWHSDYLWEEKHLNSQNKNMFDLHWILTNTLRMLGPDNGILVNLVKILNEVSLGNIPYIDIFETVFSSDVHNEHCNSDFKGCFDLKPNQLDDVMTKVFDLDQDLDISHIPTSLHFLLP